MRDIMKNFDKYIFIDREPILEHMPLRNMASYFDGKNKKNVLCNVTTMKGIKTFLQEPVDEKTSILIGDSMVCLLVLLTRPWLIKKSIFFSLEMFGYQMPCNSLIRFIKNSILKLSNYIACRIYPKVVFPNTLRRNFYIDRWQFIEKKSFSFENYFRNNTAFMGDPIISDRVIREIKQFRQNYSTIICYVGIIQPGRDIEVLIDAVDGSDVGLLLAGTDGLNITKKANNSSNICYFGRITQDEAYYVYGQSSWGYLNYGDDTPNTRFCSPVKIYEYLDSDLGVISNDNFALKSKSNLISIYYSTPEELKEIIIGLPQTKKLSVDNAITDFDMQFERLLDEITAMNN